LIEITFKQSDITSCQSLHRHVSLVVDSCCICEAIREVRVCNFVGILLLILSIEV